MQMLLRLGCWNTIYTYHTSSSKQTSRCQHSWQKNILFLPLTSCMPFDAGCMSVNLSSFACFTSPPLCCRAVDAIHCIFDFRSITQHKPRFAQFWMPGAMLNKLPKRQQKRSSTHTKKWTSDAMHLVFIQSAGSGMEQKMSSEKCNKTKARAPRTDRTKHRIIN